MLSHLRLVVSVSRQYLGYGLPHGDLIQEGNVGLMKAVKRFDPDQGVRLVSYALHWIKAEIHEYILKNWRMVKVATTKAQRKLFFNLRSMKRDMKGAASDADTHRNVADGRRDRPRGHRTERQAIDDVIEMETRLAGADVALEPQKTMATRELRADHLSGRRLSRAHPRARGAPPRLARQRRHLARARRARRAQPPHRREPLAQRQ